MKRFITFITFLTFAIALFAQAPQKMCFQTVVHDYSNNLVKNTQVTVSVSITDVSNIVVYSEQQTIVTNEDGVVTMVIGEGTPTKGMFSKIEWSAGSYYLQTDIDLNNGTKALATILPLQSVPYALYAEKTNYTYSKDEINALINQIKSEHGNN